MSKTCPKCGIEKDVSEFSKYKRSKDGLQSWCKNCKKQWREDNSEHIKQYYQDNFEHIKQCSKQHYQNNPEYYKQWCEDNPDKVRIIQHNQRNKRKEWGELIIINDYFEGSQLHHLHPDGDTRYCIYIPEELHKSILHAWNNLESMDNINKEVVKWINSGEFIKSNINQLSIYDWIEK